MFKQFAKLFLVLVVSLSLLLIQVGSINAQGLTPTPTPAANSSANSPQATIDPNELTFSMLKRSEIQLVGNYDAYSFTFFIPSGWKLKAGAQLELSLGVSFNTVIQNLANEVFTGGGTLTVLIGDQILSVIPLNQNAETTISIPIPPQLLISNRLDQSLSINFILNSGISCKVDQNTNVFIRTNSRFILPHDTIKPDTNLVNFPRPIYQDLILTDSALLVLGDKPTAAEMRAALIVAAGLGGVSGNSLLLDLTTVSNLTADKQKANHIILVGKTTSLPTLKQLNLPMPISNNQFENPQGNPDDGVIQMVNSPWSDSRVVLVVSGNSDIGVIKAAQAISTGTIRPNRSSNLAIIDKVQTTAASYSEAEDRTLAEMGYKNVVVQNRGVDSNYYIFNIPPGFNPAPGAYFDLVYGNSALLDFTRSGIVAKLNGRPIGSIHLSDVSASQAINTTRIQIPSSALVTGRNSLQLETTLSPVEGVCSDQITNQILWVNIWPESLLHLPLTETSLNPSVTTKNLSSYLPFFLSSTYLTDTAFVLPEKNPDAWRSAVKIASFLGDQANSPIIDLSVFYGNAVPPADRSKYNFVVVGRPSEIPVLSEINTGLPVPFLEKSDTPIISNYRVTYRIPPEVPMGFIEIMTSTWNPRNIILSVLGNSSQGLNWAATALTDTTLNWRLAGDFAIVNDKNILNTETGIQSVGTSVTVTPESNGTVQIPEISLTPAQPSNIRPSWILPAVGVSIALIIIILAIVIVGGWSRNRTRQKKS